MDKTKHKKTEASAFKPPTRHGKPQLPFRFLDLPAELKNTIYEYAFDESTTVLRPVGRLDRRQYKFIQELPLAGPYCQGLHPLLASNKQIRGEAIDIFYARTKFVVCERWAGDRADALMPNLGPSRRTIVGRLCYRKDVNRPWEPCENSKQGMNMLRRAVERWGLTGIALEGLEVETEGDGLEVATPQ